MHTGLLNSQSNLDPASYCAAHVSVGLQEVRVAHSPRYNSDFPFSNVSPVPLLLLCLPRCGRADDPRRLKRLFHKKWQNGRYY